MKCVRCGHNVADVNGFCSNCGYKNRTTRRSNRTYDQQPLSYDGEPSPPGARGQSVHEPRRQVRDAYKKLEKGPQQQTRIQYNHRRTSDNIDNSPVDTTKQAFIEPTPKRSRANRWKKALVVIVPIVILIVAINGGKKDGTVEPTSRDAQSQAVVNVTSSAMELQPTDVPTATSTLLPTTVPTQKPSVSMGKQNALRSAIRYLDYTAFSYTGLVKQLEFESYTNEEAKYGANNCGADWNEQAGRCARNYLEFAPFSYSGLVEQLEYEGFTNAQAKHGADKCGADWNEQAAKSAKKYLEFSSFSKQGLIDQLVYEGFTNSQAKYGVKQNGY